MLRRSLLLAVWIWGASYLDCAAQNQAYSVTYRPHDVYYLVLETEHFSVIYETAAWEEALETANRLEANLQATQQLTGKSPRFHMPVVINRFNDRSNGFVSTVPFKQEIEAVSIKGNRLTPRFDSWVQTVAPHELMHAVHADYRSGFGFSEVVRWFAPDMSRAFNLAVPPGLTEGVAVYYESGLNPRAGRLHNPLATMEFRAAMGSETPWNLSQVLERPTYTYPYDRFYTGGGQLFDYLTATYGIRHFQRSTNFHYRFPFLGYGVELWHGSGDAPSTVNSEFIEEVRRIEAARKDSLGSLTVHTTLMDRRGTRYRRPRWLDNEHLVVFKLGYETRPGFYHIDFVTGKERLISHQRITEDLYYSLYPAKDEILFSRYVDDALVWRKTIAEAYSLNLVTGKATRITRGGRLHAPVRWRQQIWGLENQGQFNQWVRVEREKTFVPLSDPPRPQYQSIEPAPNSNRVAVLLKSGTHQQVYQAVKAGGQYKLIPWIGFEDATVFDISWSPDGRYLLFSADPGGILNVYALDILEDRVYKLTNVLYGALEGTLSPDGKTLAFINYEHERYALAIQSFDLEKAVEVPRTAVRPVQIEPVRRPELAFSDADTSGYTVRSYRSLRYLRPRMVYPTVRYDWNERNTSGFKLGVGAGLALQGTDPLGHWAYLIEGYYQKSRVWGEFSLSNGSTFLRPQLKAYSSPSTVQVQRVDTGGNIVDTVRVGRERQGVKLDLRTPITLSSNVFRSQLIPSLQGGYERERLFDEAGKSLTEYANRIVVTPGLALLFHVQQNRRDLVPNTGIVFRSSATADLETSQAQPRRAFIGLLDKYLPWLRRHNIGLRIKTGVVVQNQAEVYNLDTFKPRGYEDRFMGSGTYLKYGLEYFQPLWFIDRGLVLLPLYFKAIYAYGFGEAVQPISSSEPSFSSVGAGIGFQFQFFYYFGFDMRFGLSYLVEQQEWKAVFR